jgi:F420 biosynthesis protein FbiB-like protein
LVEAGDARIGLARAMSARLRSDRLADGDPADLVEADVTRSGRRLTDAPVLIIVALTMVDMDRYADARRSHAEYLMAVQSTGMAMQNLLLAAAEAGLGACVMCGPLFCPDTVGAALQLPADWQPQAAVTMGWPMDSEKDRPRRPRRPLADIMIRRGASSGNRAPTEP